MTGATTPAPRASVEPRALLVQIAELTTELVQPPQHEADELEALYANAEGTAREALGRQLIRAHVAEIEALATHRAARVTAVREAEESAREERREALAATEEEAEHEVADEAPEPAEEEVAERDDDDDDGWDDEEESDDWDDDDDGWDDEEEEECDDWDEEWGECGEWAEARRTRAFDSRAKKDAAPRRMDRRARRDRRRARLRRRRARQRRSARAPRVAAAPRRRRARTRRPEPRVAQTDEVREARSELRELDADLAERRRGLSRLGQSFESPQLATELQFAQLWSAWRTGAANASTLAQRFTEAHPDAGDLLGLAWMVRAELSATLGDSQGALSAFRFGMNRLGEPIYAYALWRAAQVRDEQGDDEGAEEARRALAHAGCAADAHAIIRTLSHDAAAALGEGVRRDPDGALRPQSCAAPDADDEAGWRPEE